MTNKNPFKSIKDAEKKIDHDLERQRKRFIFRIRLWNFIPWILAGLGLLAFWYWLLSVIS